MRILLSILVISAGLTYIIITTKKREKDKDKVMIFKRKYKFIENE